jgi:hypothetical protein
MANETAQQVPVIYDGRTIDEALTALQFMRSSMRRFCHLEYCLETYNFIPGVFVELGVFKGETLNFIAGRQQRNKIYGFDSFKGLPEKWQHKNNMFKEKGRWAVNKLPEVRENITLIKGLFKDSIPQWKNKKPISFLHVDCDLYSSTYTALTLLNKLIVKRTLILFDELYDWTSKGHLFHLHEWRAFVQWVIEYKRKFFIYSRSRDQRAAFVIEA